MIRPRTQGREDAANHFPSETFKSHNHAGETKFWKVVRLRVWCTDYSSAGITKQREKKAKSSHPATSSVNTIPPLSTADSTRKWQQADKNVLHSCNR